MRMYDLIMKKKRGGEMTADEIRFIVDAFTKGEIPSEQMSAFLMAVRFRGMTDAETTALTLAMAASGGTADLSAIPGKKVDKHSTGGVGDKTTLIVAPIVAACGGVVAKMSGRGLGHTGGTIDKLESIPGFCGALGEEKFAEVVRQTGLAVTGQSADLAPADKKMYALRDVTATVDSIPLIASSVMSKKLAGGDDCILLDVTVGSGAFMKSFVEARKLANTMVAIGEMAGRRTAALITDMDVPLGCAVGNAIEVIEAIETLHGAGADDLREICIALASEMLALVGKGTVDECRQMATQVLDDGRAFLKLCEMVEAQGGDVRVLREPSLLSRAAHRVEVCAAADAYMTKMNAEQVGIASMLLGAGRETLEDVIDPAAGITLLKKPGDFVKRGETIAILHTNDMARIEAAKRIFTEAVRYGDAAPKEKPIVMARVDKDGIEMHPSLAGIETEESE